MQKCQFCGKDLYNYFTIVRFICVHKINLKVIFQTQGAQVCRKMNTALSLNVLLYVIVS